MSMQKTLQVLRPGLVGYREAWQLQKDLAARRALGEIPDTLILLEHPHTITLGSRANRADLHRAPEEYAASGVEVIDTDRGGEITYHGPGQLVGYPILKLHDHTRDLHLYMRMLEQVIIDTLADFQIDAVRNEGHTGVWTKHGKIASIGIRVSRWITLHGFALNVHSNLDAFSTFVPCGIVNCPMTSVENENKKAGRCDTPGLSEVGNTLIAAFCHVFKFPQPA